MVVKSSHIFEPSYQDLVSYVLGHDKYDVDKRILVDAINTEEHISLRKARWLVRLLVAGLTRHGAENSDTVCVHLFNHIMYPVLFLGIVGAGQQFTGSNPAYKLDELSHHFKASRTRFVITARHHLDVVKEAATANGIAHNRIFVLDYEEGDPRCGDCSSFHRLFQCGEMPWRAFDDPELSKATPAALLTTSGTTGNAKMAVRSHMSWVAENQAIEDREEKPYAVRRLLTVPFFHAFAGPLALISALRSGHTTYIMQRYDQSDYLGAIERLKITETALAPPLMVRFLGLPAEQLTMLSSLELVWCGGAPLAREIQNKALQMFAQEARICQVYGMTEGGWMTTFTYPERDETGSSGRLVGSYEAKVIDDDGHEVTRKGPNNPGEILVRGPITMGQYLDNPVATSEQIDSDGWNHTGDVGYFGKDDKLYLIDRKKELIKVNGWQVAPGELEARLLEHEDIIDAGVIGIPLSKLATEIPRAYVVCRQGQELSEKQVVNHLLKTLANYKVRDTQVRFRDSIPKSATGKILRKELREEAAKERALLQL